MSKSKKDELKAAEKAAMIDSESQNTAASNEQNVDEAEVDAEMMEAGADANSVMSAESAAVNTDTETAIEASEAKVTKGPKKVAKSAVAKKRSVKYQKAAATLVDANPKKLEDAIDLVKGSSYSKFDGTIEVHARMALKKKETTDSIRALVQLPNGAPSQVNAVVLTEQLIDEIATTKKTDADIYLATPALMPKVAKIARILGPQGKMPNPKTGTVSEDPTAALAEIQSGRIEYRADSHGIVHLGVGKVSWSTDKIVGNVQAVIQSLGANRLRSFVLTSTMGPSVTIDLATLTA